MSSPYKIKLPNNEPLALIIFMQYLAIHKYDNAINSVSITKTNEFHYMEITLNYIPAIDFFVYYEFRKKMANAKIKPPDAIQS